MFVVRGAARSVGVRPQQMANAKAAVVRIIKREFRTNRSIFRWESFVGIATSLSARWILY